MGGKVLWMGAALALFAWGCKEKPHAGHEHEHGEHEHMEHAAPGEEADAAVAAKKAQTTCPVMGGKIDRSLYVDHDGKRVYVCCRACISAIEKDPEKYVKQLEAEGVELESVPAAN